MLTVDAPGDVLSDSITNSLRSSQDKVHLEVDVDPTEVVGDAAPLRDRDAASLKPLTTEKEPSPDSLRGGVRESRESP